MKSNGAQKPEAFKKRPIASSVRNSLREVKRMIRMARVMNANRIKALIGAFLLILID
jgi:hypothetical protein